MDSRKLTTVIVLILAFAFSGCSDRASSIYINADEGRDSNPGTRSRPLKTIEELNARLQETPADVYFAPGQTYRGTLVLKGYGENGSKPLRITTAGRRRAIIDGGDSEAIIIDRCTGIVIYDLKLRGSGRKDGNTRNGLWVRRSEKIRIFSIKAERFQKSGVELFNCTDAEVRGVTAVNNGFAGINVIGSSRDSSKNIVISGCSAVNNPGDPTRLDNHSGNGILAGVSDNVTIRGCRATRNGWDMPREGNGPVGIWAWESSNVNIMFCASYGNMTRKNAKDGGGFDLDGGITDSNIKWCISFGNQGAGYGLFQYAGASPWANNRIEYCISLHDATTTAGSGSIFIWNGSRDSSQLSGCTIRNNIIINSGAPLISYEKDSDHEGFLFTKNIFLGADTINGHSRGSRFVRNIWLGEEK